MHGDRPISIVQGEHGRVTVNLDDRSLVAHAHGEFHIIFKLSGGDAHFRLERDVVEVTDRQALLIRPWVAHAKLAGDQPCLLLVLLLSPTWLRSTFETTQDALVAAFREPGRMLDDAMRENAQHLAALVSDATEHDLSRIEEAVRVVVGSVLRDDLPLRSGERDIVPRLVDGRIRRALDIMNREPVATLQIDSLAERIGLSRSRFFEQFKRTVGVTPLHYIDWIRIRHATQLLSDTDRTIADISEELGFTTQNHFSRFFSEHLGLPPGEFRRRTVRAEPQRDVR